MLTVASHFFGALHNKQEKGARIPPPSPHQSPQANHLRCSACCRYTAGVLFLHSLRKKMRPLAAPKYNHTPLSVLDRFPTCPTFSQPIPPHATLPHPSPPHPPLRTAAFNPAHTCLRQNHFHSRVDYSIYTALSSNNGNIATACGGQVLGKVRRTVIVHVPMEHTPGVVSASDNLSEDRENSA